MQKIKFAGGTASYQPKKRIKTADGLGSRWVEDGPPIVCDVVLEIDPAAIIRDYASQVVRNKTGKLVRAGGGITMYATNRRRQS